MKEKIVIVKKNYNKLSKFYNLFEGITEKKLQKKGIKKLNIKTGEKILEIGFGTGNSIYYMAKIVGKTGKIYGIDISEKMVKIATKKLEKYSLLNRVELKLGNALNLPYKNNFFDAIFISFTLEIFNTTEIDKILHQCKKVLKNKGKICVISISKDNKKSFIFRIYNILHNKFPKVIDCKPIDIEYILQRNEFNILNVDKINFWGIPVKIVLAINSQ